MTADAALAQKMARLPPAERMTILASLDESRAQELLWDWRFWARPAQLAPQGHWRTWMIMAGRGFGKTRTGAEWIRSRAERQPELRAALVGATFADVRSVMVEGESGLLAISPPHARPRFEPSKQRLTWPSGAQAFLYSAAEPDALRGPQHHIGWCDELAKWPDAQAVWDMLWLGLRLGDAPQVVVTTTPRPVNLVRSLLDAPDTVVTRGRTQDNPCLPPAFVEAVEARYAGTRLGRQELDGELIADVAGALWTRGLLDAGRVRTAPDCIRVVVAIDPPVSSGGDADACGIIAAGLGHDGHGYVLADETVQGLRPEGWMQQALAACRRHGADRLVAEVNNGGDLIETLLRSRDETIAYRPVRAARGKHARAEPVAALYEQGRVHHVGGFAELEDELCALLPGGRLAGSTASPDRLDALVWALTDLMLRQPVLPAIRSFA